MTRTEINEMTNTQLIILLCQSYKKETRSAMKNAQMAIDELGRRSLVYEEDLEEEFFKDIKR